MWKVHTNTTARVCENAVNQMEPNKTIKKNARFFKIMKLMLIAHWFGMKIKFNLLWKFYVYALFSSLSGERFALLHMFSNRYWNRWKFNDLFKPQKMFKIIAINFLRLSTNTRKSSPANQINEQTHHTNARRVLIESSKSSHSTMSGAKRVKRASS